MAKVLIIDDDEMMCDTLGRIIRQLGHDTTYSHTIRDGREKIVLDPYDVVLLDVQLPDGSGLELLPEIKKKTVSPPEVIIITSAGDPDGAEPAVAEWVFSAVSMPQV